MYKFISYTPTDQHFPVSELPDSLEKRTLQHLGVEQIPLLQKILCYHKYYYPLRFAAATKPQFREHYAIAHLNPLINQFTTANKFQSNAIYIKKYDKVLLYYLGVYKDDNNNIRVIKMYIPRFNDSKKLQYHLNIIRQLQSCLSEAGYKDLKRVLNLHIANDDICVTFYHHFLDKIVTAHFDFLNKVTTTCMNFSKLADDPVGFLLSLYHSTKAYREGRECPVDVETSDQRLR